MQNYIVYVHGARVQLLRRHGLPDHPEPTGAADRHFNQLVYALQWPPAYPDCPDLHVLRHWQRVMGVRHGGGRADGDAAERTGDGPADYRAAVGALCGSPAAERFYGRNGEDLSQYPAVAPGVLLFGFCAGGAVGAAGAGR